jgi:PII-like signaling protein
MIPPEASLLRVYVNSSHRWQGGPLYRAIVETARARGVAGASVFPVEVSFGARRLIRDVESDYQFFDIPVVVEVVDAPERVEALLAELGPMLRGGLMTVSPVRVVHER